MTSTVDVASPSTGTARAPLEPDLLDAARHGDSEAFGHLVERYRRELKTHSYRMLGSYDDAEDALQETLLRAWRALPRFEGRSSIRSWLYRIATNTCLRAIERRPKRILPIDYAPASDPRAAFAEPVNEPIWLESYPDAELGLVDSGPAARYEQREAVELAFIAALQHLPARQRAVLILRDVLGFSARETAAALQTTPVSVDSALQRAHRTVDARLPTQTQQETIRLIGGDDLRKLVKRYVAAWERNDIAELISLLAEDVRMAMPPLPIWYSGRVQVAAFLRRYALSGRKSWRLVPTAANGQVALAGYLWDGQVGAFAPYCLYVLALRGRQIAEITAFVTPSTFQHFGLPQAVAR